MAAAAAAAELVSTAAIYAYWKDFDLDNRRPKLDEVGLKVADLQEASAANRKQLADATREFKRSTAGAAESEYVTAVAALLKRYQEEIDALTRRAKHGEGAFLDVYQQLSEAPDPAPALAAALDAETQLAQLTAQVQKVSSELAEYKAESKAIKNQDLTIRKQEEAIRELSAALEAKDRELSDTRQQAAAEADKALLAKMEARESELSEMLSSTQSSLEAMQRLYAAAQNQLFELQSNKEAAVVVKQEEMEFAAAELEAVQSRLLALETERNSLAARLETNRQEAAAGSEAAASTSSSVEDTLRQELNSQREVAAVLRQDLAAARHQLHDMSAQWEEHNSSLQEQLQQQAVEVQRLQLELQQRPTAARVVELQQQIRVLQAVGYGSLPEEDLGLGSGPGLSLCGLPTDSSSGGALDPQTSSSGRGSEAGGAGVGVQQLQGSASASLGPGSLNLEGLLLSKNRKLEHEVTVARLALAEANQQLEAAQEQVTELQDQLQQRSDLVTQLEEDLMSIRQTSHQGPTAAAGAGAAAAAGGSRHSMDGRSPTHLAAGAGGSADLSRAASTAAAVAAAVAGGVAGTEWGSSGVASGDGSGAGAGGGGSGEGSESMLRVLVGQRDRLRARVQELEVALASSRHEATAAQQQLAAARADNVALIERLRYVGGYRQQMASGRVSQGLGGGDVEKGGGSGDVVGKYSQLYDEGINPFKEFQGQQREQKRKQMSVADKAMYSMGSLVYQSAAGRLFTFGYLVVLHLLVFLTLTHMTHRTSTHLEAHQELALSSISRHDLTGALHGTFATTAAEAAASPLTQAPAGLGQLAPPPPPPP